MVKRPKRPRDANQLAKLIVDISTGEVQETPESQKAKVGRLGDMKGGVARARILPAYKRVQIAKKAAKTRWAKRRKVGAGES